MKAYFLLVDGRIQIRNRNRIQKRIQIQIRTYGYYGSGSGWIRTHWQKLLVSIMLAFLGVIEGGAHKQVRVSVPVHIHARQRVAKTRGEPVT
jgi:hypothetical protein